MQIDFEDYLSNTDGLRQMAVVNEYVKEVLRISAEVNLVALNAMLAAHQAGESSRGFGVVSSELRVLSGKLDKEMLYLVELVSGAVRDTAVLQRRRRILRLLNIANQGERAASLLGDVLAREVVALHEASRVIQARKQLLRVQVLRTLKLCATGNALARSAKIESVYGGVMLGTLRQVANRIESAVDEILATLKQIQVQMAG